jgi:GT2 family glycosyltransferase
VRAPDSEHDAATRPAAVREITAVLVSWNDAEDLAGAIESLSAARRRLPNSGPKVSLVVVDNGDAAREVVLARWPAATLLVNAENRGFGPAANQGAELASGDVLLFVNPDTRAVGDPFTPIARAFESDAAIVAVAPRLVDPRGAIVFDTAPRPLAPPDQEDQFTFQLRHLPTLGADLRELLLLDHAFPNSAARRASRYADADRSRPFDVEQPAAAALAIRRTIFEKVSGFDPRFVPAWFEDVDLADRLRREGRIVFWPEALFRHRGGSAASGLGYARFLPIYYRNALLYRRARYGWAARVLYRLGLIAGMLLRLVLTPFRRKPPRPASVSARAYLRVLGLALGLSSPEFRVPSPDSR